MNNKLSKKHLPSPDSALVPLAHTPFIDYVETTRNRISLARIDLTPTTAKSIIDANCPFEWRPDALTSPRKGILLIHGLLDSPYGVRDLAHYFLKRGFLVRSILLPGHGTVPGDLLTTHYSDWLKAAAYGIDSFSGGVDELYCLGISGGATMALYHALALPTLKGLFLFAPSIKLRSRYAFAGSWLKHLGKLYTPAEWYRLASDRDYAHYESFPYHFVEQAYRLTRVFQEREKNARLTMPLFMVLTKEDETIDSAAAEAFFSRHHHPHSRLVIYSPTPVQTVDPRIEWRTSCFPEDHILNFSHICLGIDPDNPHYGRHGDYPVLLPPLAVDEVVYKGAVKPGSSGEDGGPRSRLTYNPDFGNLLGRMDGFLDRLGDGVFDGRKSVVSP